MFYKDINSEESFNEQSLDTAIRTIACPYCGEMIQIVIDPGIGDQETSYIEDCSVCCRPMELTVHIDADGCLNLVARHENE